MTCFSIRKYLSLTKSSLLVDWRGHAVFVSLLVAAFLGLFAFYNNLVEATLTGLTPEEEMIQAGIYGFLKIVIFLGIIAVIVGFCSSHSVYFLGMRNSPNASVMQSATPLERFAVVITRSFLISALDALLAFALADILQWLITGNFPVDYYGDIDWDYVAQTNALPSGVKQVMNQAIAAVSLTVLFCCFWFTFCASVFSRHPFIFGMLCLWVFSQLVSLALFFVVGFTSHFSLLSESGIDAVGAQYIFDGLALFFDWLIAIICVATLLFMYISYRRMKTLANTIYE